MLNEKKIRLSDKNVLFLITAIWFFLAVSFIFLKPVNVFSHDVGAELEYTKIIVHKHRAPLSSDETYVAHQPPLYFLLNSTFYSLPDELHIKYVQALSVVFGFICLLVLYWFISKVTGSLMKKLLVLLLLLTTPKFVFLFTTYNNDSLAALLTFLLIAVSYSQYKNWSTGKGALLFLITALGVYTKYTMIWCISSVLITVLISSVFSKKGIKTFAKFLLIFSLAVISHLPYLYMHNYKNTGNVVIPMTPVEKVEKKVSFAKTKSKLFGLIENPFFIKTSSKWKSPWVDPNQKRPPATCKRSDFLTTSFLTSIISERVFNNINKNIVYLILAIHFFFAILGALSATLSNIGRASLLAMLITLFIHLISASIFITSPVHTCYMDYRYIPWNWIPGAVLLTSLLSNKPKLVSKGLYVLSVLLIALQVFFLFKL